MKYENIFKLKIIVLIKFKLNLQKKESPVCVQGFVDLIKINEQNIQKFS